MPWISALAQLPTPATATLIFPIVSASREEPGGRLHYKSATILLGKLLPGEEPQTSHGTENCVAPEPSHEIISCPHNNLPLPKSSSHHESVICVRVMCTNQDHLVIGFSVWGIKRLSSRLEVCHWMPSLNQYFDVPCPEHDSSGLNWTKLVAGLVGWWVMKCVKKWTAVDARDCSRPLGHSTSSIASTNNR